MVGGGGGGGEGECETEGRGEAEREVLEDGVEPVIVVAGWLKLGVGEAVRAVKVGRCDS